VIATATTLEEALWLEANGVDAIIVQGLEAGGHRGMFLSDDLSTQVGLVDLLPQIVKQVRIPVIATGGIADSNDVKVALSLGASAVQVGTAYLLCSEATTSVLHREALAGQAAQYTELTSVFSGKPARGIVNRAMSELGCFPETVPSYPYAANEITQLRKLAEAQNSFDFSPLWSGQNVSGCEAISAAELTKKLAAF
jgi:nitronate monooxygenase